MGSLEGRVAVITGAGRGIGREHALLFAREGAKVVVNDLGGAEDGSGSDAGPAQQVVEEIKAMGGEAVANTDSCADWEGGQRLIQTAIDTFGELHVLVNNAGILRDRTIAKMTLQEWREVIDVNLSGVFHCCKWGLEILRDGGAIVSMGSLSAEAGFHGQTNYAAAKAGIVALARTWALELARAEVTVNAIVPTAWTAMTATIPIYKPLVARVAAGEPLPAAVRREHAIGHPEDCAGLVVFLASNAAGGISGQAIGVGGDRLCLYTHPAEVVTELREGGWDADAVAAVWQARFAAHAQPVGIRLPKLEIE
jgi:NAD(P)-dependent dehydrogenase (short-subunit alcohol dehydrogenase family)